MRGQASGGTPRLSRLQSLTEPFIDVDTSTPMGKAIVSIMAARAQLR